jgi:hypothetical protein
MFCVFGFLGVFIFQDCCARHSSSQNGRCPLSFAATGGKGDFVSLLLDSGADKDAQDNVRHMAL